MNAAACWFKADGPDDKWQLGVCHSLDAASKTGLVVSGEHWPVDGRVGEGEIYVVPIAQIWMGRKHPGNLERIVTVPTRANAANSAAVKATEAKKPA